MSHLALEFPFPPLYLGKREGHKVAYLLPEGRDRDTQGEMGGYRSEDIAAMEDVGDMIQPESRVTYIDDMPNCTAGIMNHIGKYAIVRDHEESLGCLNDQGSTFAPHAGIDNHQMDGAGREIAVVA